MKKILLVVFIISTIWSVINPHDMFTWWLEAAPALLGLVIVLASYKKFPLTNLLYILLTIHAVILLVGAHYTYAQVPLFDWLKDVLDLSRNHYDRVGHFAQGFVPAMIARELLLRTSPLQHGKWLFTIITLACLGISAAYELIEWVVAVSTGEGADAFLGTQGDVWDTQKDMFFAMIGAISAQLLLWKKHDEQLARIT